MQTLKLSVLVASVPSRLSFFYPRLMKQLIDQTKERNDVEILGFFDNKKRSVGQKRQGLLDLANGEYVVFIDDDDRITDNYIEKIMNTLYENNNVDCVVFNTICKVNNGEPKLCKYGIEFEYGDIKINQKKEWRGKPAHTMVYKSSIAKKHRYSDLSNGEDIDWVKRAYLDIKTQIRIDEVLYFYDANYTTTSETASLSDAVIEQNINKLLNFIN
jgi:glycosyltransferase involved in cell wall biosynthesis